VAPSCPAAAADGVIAAAAAPDSARVGGKCARRQQRREQGREAPRLLSHRARDALAALWRQPSRSRLHREVHAPQAAVARLGGRLPRRRRHRLREIGRRRSALRTRRRLVSLRTTALPTALRSLSNSAAASAASASASAARPSASRQLCHWRREEELLAALLWQRLRDGSRRG